MLYNRKYYIVYKILLSYPILYSMLSNSILFYNVQSIMAISLKNDILLEKRYLLYNYLPTYNSQLRRIMSNTYIYTYILIIRWVALFE